MSLVIILIISALALFLVGAVTLPYTGLAIFPYAKGAGGLSQKIVDIDGSSSYTTGGTSLTAASLGFNKILFAYAMAANDSSNHCQVTGLGKGLRGTIKLMWFVASTGAEVANATNLSSKSTKLLIIGLAK